MAQNKNAEKKDNSTTFYQIRIYIKPSLDSRHVRIMHKWTYNKTERTKNKGNSNWKFDFFVVYLVDIVVSLLLKLKTIENSIDWIREKRIKSTLVGSVMWTEKKNHMSNAEVEFDQE